MLLYEADRCKTPPEIRQAFREGGLPWTKVREVAKVAKPENEREWLAKCQSLSNRQLEKEVQRTIPLVTKKTLVLILKGDAIETWQAAREAMERLAGKSLSDIEVFDLMRAEVLCTHDLTRRKAILKMSVRTVSCGALPKETDGSVLDRLPLPVGAPDEPHHSQSPGRP